MKLLFYLLNSNTYSLEILWAFNKLFFVNNLGQCVAHASVMSALDIRMVIQHVNLYTHKAPKSSERQEGLTRDLH